MIFEQRRGQNQREDIAGVIHFGQTNLTDYSRGQIIGKGTYGEVTKCRHIKSKRSVAIKSYFYEVSLPNIAHGKCLDL